MFPDVCTYRYREDRTHGLTSLACMSKKELVSETTDPGNLPSEEEISAQEGGITKTGMKKTIWVHRDEAEALRDAAYKLRRTESSIIREAIRHRLGIED